MSLALGLLILAGAMMILILTFIGCAMLVDWLDQRHARTSWDFDKETPPRGWRRP